MSEPLEELRREIREMRQELSLKDTRIGDLTKTLSLLAAQEMKLHTTLKLGTTIEKFEDLMKPENVSRNDWLDVPRLQKWTDFFSNPEEYVEYEDFITSVQSISTDPARLAKLVKKLYGVVNAQVHNYVNDGQISTDSFREDEVKLLASCFDSIDV